ncbi:HEAT repeat-containing protein 4 isoform X2 [Aplysia californica]|uniref:HEAT repeat-containing protein 4 isoform X2 n=1 Tax=Aplysia californica TaxID=6500 RepID=A0ABM0JAC6_APLCA|nr:HEAT repeat-containing protein 4 isoform X2 [Aplysia californica]
MASKLNSTLSERTMLFPCAAGVQVPQIGAEDSKVKVMLNQRSTPSILPMTIVSQDVNPASERYVQMVSSGLSFSQDVVEDRCLHMMPYDTKYFSGVFEPGELLPPPRRSSSVMGRHNKRGVDARHMPCYLKKIAKPAPLTPLRKQVKEKALQLHKEALSSKQKDISRDSFDGSTSPSSFFMTEVSSQEQAAQRPKLKPIPESRESKLSKVTLGSKQGETVKADKTIKQDDTVSRLGTAVSFRVTDEIKSRASGASIGTRDTSELSQIPKNDWDDHLMSRLSKLTANWIVHEKLPADGQKEKLAHVLESWYGPPTHTDLVREQASDGEEDEKAKEQKPKSKWKKKEASVLERVYNVRPSLAEAIDPYSDDNKAPFYRQPAGIRKKKRSEEKEEAGAINATAHNISVRGYTETPPMTLKDVLSPRVGNKIYNTGNAFEQEWLTGSKQVYKAGGDPNEITMDTDNKYKKQVQRELPQRPETWYTLENEKKSAEKAASSQHIPEKGQKRWVALPELIDETEGTVNANSDGFDTGMMKAVDPKQRRRVKQNHALVTIVHDWRSKWFLSGQFADSTPDDLIRDMADIQPHVRLKAIGTVAKASEYKPPPDMTVMLESSEYDPVKELPEKIFVALECLLDDSHDQVKKAAAITLYSLDRPSEKAKEQLRHMLMGSSSVDRWAAAQCLAQFGESDSDVVAEIIKQILSTEVAVKLEQGIHLLAKISNSSTLVHCMVAEQLNSSSWRHRVIACKILPTLFGSINRDITQKLSELMWHDWHVEVRRAAGQCLGKTSHGRDVHDDIRERILHGGERTKMDAINKLGQLGIMTAKLLPAFLECFADSYVSIRSEVCITCGNLGIKEEQVIDRLVHLATFDPIWKVKALAIQALGKIGVENSEIKECLLWAMRYEERPGVRAEACHSLVALDIQDDDVIEALQDRLLVESSPVVREEMVEALSLFGLSTSEDMDMVAQIKSEVRKLCTRNIIASQIIVNENDETKRAQLERMVCQTEKDIEALNEKKAVILQRIRSQARSTDSLGSTPQPRTSTPLPKTKRESESTTPEPVSREGTVFTPTADRELEAILNQEEIASASGSVSVKSRPTTGASEEMETEEYTAGAGGQDEVKVPSRITITKAADDEDAAVAQSGDDAAAETADVVDIGVIPGSAEGVEGESSKQTSGKHRLSLPLNSQKGSRLGFLSPTGSFVDMKGSRLSVAQFSDRRSVISRDSLREREKVNAEVNAIYTDLNARYADMVDDLIKIDRGLNTKGSSTDSSISATPKVMPGLVTSIDYSEVEKLLRRSINEESEESPRVEEGSGEENKGAEAQIEEEGTTNGEEQGEAGDEGEPKSQEDKEHEQQGFAESEWKSYADTLSHDGYTTDATSYPSYDENDDVDIAPSHISTAGVTAQASEYDNYSERGIDSEDETAQPINQPEGEQ